jgi:TolA-binding protein
MPLVGEEHRTYRWGGDQTAPKRRFTVAEAAEVLQLSAEAVRSRIKRGSLQSVKEGNTVYVLLDADQARPSYAQTSDQTTALIANLQDQVAYLRGELARREETHLEESRRKDSIIAALTQRIPELEAATDTSGASEPRQSPTEATEQPGRVEPQPAVESAQEPREPSEMHMPEAAGGPLPHDLQRASERPWWRRVFGG